MAGRVNGFDPQVAVVALDERMTNVSRRVDQLDNNITRIGSSLETQLEALSNKFAESRRPQWQAISVTVGVIALIGGFAYWPINTSLSELKAGMIKLSDESLSPSERQYRTDRNTEDRTAHTKEIDDLGAEIAAVRAGSVPMQQWAEQIHGRDVQIDDMGKRVDAQFATLNARVDENRAVIASMYSARDVLMELRNQLNELRQRIEAAP